MQVLGGDAWALYVCWHVEDPTWLKIVCRYRKSVCVVCNMISVLTIDEAGRRNELQHKLPLILFIVVYSSCFCT